jgi:hypothetical protein
MKKSQLRHSARAVRTKRSAIAFAFGARTGVRMTWMPSLSKTTSKLCVNLLSRSRIRKRSGVDRSGSSQTSWRACWVTQLPLGFAVQPASGGEKDAIGGPQLRTSDLTTQHRKLVAEHHDLQLLELARAKAQRSELQNASKYEIAERPDQEPAPSGRRDGHTTLRPKNRLTHAEPG